MSPIRFYLQSANKILINITAAVRLIGSFVVYRGGRRVAKGWPGAAGGGRRAGGGWEGAGRAKSIVSRTRNTSLEHAPDQADLPDQAEVVAATAPRTPPSTRAGG